MRTTRVIILSFFYIISSLSSSRIKTTYPDSKYEIKANNDQTNIDSLFKNFMFLINQDMADEKDTEDIFQHDKKTIMGNTQHFNNFRDNLVKRKRNRGGAFGDDYHNDSAYDNYYDDDNYLMYNRRPMFSGMMRRKRDTNLAYTRWPILRWFFPTLSNEKDLIRRLREVAYDNKRSNEVNEDKRSNNQWFVSRNHQSAPKFAYAHGSPHNQYPNGRHVQFR